MKCLLLVDIQNGFCPGGNLAVPDGDTIVPVANRLMAEGGYDLIVASQDWHPADHGSFASQHEGAAPFTMGTLNGQPQMLWPDHCVQGTEDAALRSDLDLDRIDLIQQKGLDRRVDSYSAFRDNDRAALTGLSELLSARGVTRLDICGLATDYCVKFSALDARTMLPEAQIRFIEDASRGIDPAGLRNAIDAMTQARIAVVTSHTVLSETVPSEPRA
ncbi:nicotinamidase [Rhizobium sp. Leaf371]|uniref:bifunctional nicotinamidase/pyrazinamidase n=1 Tax=Rhizobium sp. Leaf371 TaxID=1736355 RepID=UPI000713E0D3|nr:bifunctional nicotinamidase/pyrazinamidase [Rhizobium sp. Leaf371]KQS72659.1 nicotinamidase [Rhizobium sp. Leaf371]